jgi:hypothetical protein
MKIFILLLGWVLLASSCNTAKNKSGNEMVDSGDYTLQIEVIRDKMPSNEPVDKKLYAIISVKTGITHTHKWKFHEALVVSNDNKYTLQSFDNSAFFEEGQQQIMTNLRGIPDDVIGSLSFTLTLVDESGKQLVLRKENVKVMEVY